MFNIDMYIISALIGAVTFGLVLILFAPLDIIKSKSPIKPELNIKVINGISDTTYIYKNK
jgi:hypothetical protein